MEAEGPLGGGTLHEVTGHWGCVLGGVWPSSSPPAFYFPKATKGEPSTVHSLYHRLPLTQAQTTMDYNSEPKQTLPLIN